MDALVFGSDPLDAVTLKGQHKNMETQVQLYRIINEAILFLLVAYVIYGFIKIRKRDTHFKANEVVAGFWLRIFSGIIDFTILFLLFLVILCFFDPFGLEGCEYFETMGEIFVVWIYYAGLHASKLQATLGKKILGLKVVDGNGKRIGFVKSSERFLGAIISQIFFYFGYIMIAFTKYKQAFHDMTTGTFVVKMK